MSGLQVQLYEDFAKSRAKCDIDETVSSISLNEETEKPKLKSTGHVFQVVFFSNFYSLVYTCLVTVFIGLVKNENQNSKLRHLWSYDLSRIFMAGM